MSKRFLITFLLVCLSSCSTCDYQNCLLELPSESIQSAFKDAQENEGIVFTECLEDRWWVLFNDDQLSCFIESALSKNPTLQKAYANILLAQAKADRVRSFLLPNILWAADVSRQKLSETGLVPFSQAVPPGIEGPAPAQLVAAGGTAGIPVYFTQSETEFNLSFDFDIWNKNRNTWAAALSEVQAAVADDAFARLELSIAIAQVYYQLQIDYRRLDIAAKLVEISDQYTNLVEGRFDHSLDSGINVQQAKTSISSAKRAAIQLQGDIIVNENKLRAYLAGQFDEDIFANQIDQRPLPLIPVPVDLPLHLISRRPDLIAQLWQIESAGKRIEVAKAGFYPDFNLNALFGYQTIRLHKWFEWPSVFFNVDPAVSLPFFDGGRLTAELIGSERNYDLAISTYNEKILNAVREVLDGLALVRNRYQQLKEFKDKLEQQEQVYHLTELRTEHNLDSDLDLILSEAQLLPVKDQQLMGLGQTLQASLMLIKATGGGFLVDCAEKVGE